MFSVLGVGKGNSGIVALARIIEYACISVHVAVWCNQTCIRVPVAVLWNHNSDPCSDSVSWSFIRISLLFMFTTI